MLWLYSNPNRRGIRPANSQQSQQPTKTNRMSEVHAHSAWQQLLLPLLLVMIQPRRTLSFWKGWQEPQCNSVTAAWSLETCGTHPHHQEGPGDTRHQSIWRRPRWTCRQVLGLHGSAKVRVHNLPVHDGSRNSQHCRSIGTVL